MREPQPAPHASPRHRRQEAGIPRQVALTSVAGLAALATAALAGLPGGLAAWLAAGAAYLLVCAAAAGAMARSYPHDRIGGGNMVTLIRAALVAALLPPLLSGQPAGWPVAAVAALALALDGVDGWLARRSGLASDFGGRFDIEVDAALALILSLHALAGTAVGPQVLLLGLIRYGFVAAVWRWRWLGASLPSSLRRKLVCVAQMGALIALQPMLLPAEAAQWMVRGVAAALVWSFAVDIRWLARRAP